jgi:ribonuclease inhibitor
VEVSVIVEIEGLNIRSEADFHREIAQALNLGSYYGKNLDALWDVLNREVERPVSLIWKNSDVSRDAMQGNFERIFTLLQDVERQDASYGIDERFEVLVK